MAILSNTPTLSYIYVREMVITYNDVPYNILNMYSMKPYWYWDSSDPYKLIASNTILEEKSGRFYICFNDRGNPTMVPQPDLQISFAESGNGSGDLITEKILGFQESLEANEYRFTTIETDVNHLKTIVGGSSGDNSNLTEQFSKIEQEMNRIDMEVSKVERQYNDNEELRLLRENTNIAILKLQATLGTFLSDMQEIMEDNELTDEEMKQIEIYKSNMETEREKLNTQIDNVIARLTAQGDANGVTKLTTQKELLNGAISNLYSNINTACTDGKFTNMEMMTVISYFSTVGNKINETNSMIDEFIFLESGGKLIEELAKLTIEQNEIKQSVSKSESDIEDVIIKLEKTIARIDNYYYLSSSKDELKDGEWSTDAPSWTIGKFLWTKTITTYTDGSTEESDPVCITTQEDNISLYTWIRYADDEQGNGISNDPTGKNYIGFAYNKMTQTESENPSDYIWSRFRGIDGINGEDGTSVKILGSYNSVEELNQAHPTNNNNGDGYIVNGDLYVWDGDEFLNAGQIKGDDGLTAYVHIKYSNDQGKTFTPSNGEEVGDYMGIYTDNIEADSLDVSSYTWSKIKGEDGIPGENGKDGNPNYTWIRYSDDENGLNMYDRPNSLTVYIGIATNKDTPTESNNPSDYVWSRFKGADGVDGTSVKILGTYNSLEELNQAHPDNNTNGDGYIVNGDLYVWDGDEFINVGQIKGEDGRGIVSITPEYYLSTSKTSQIGGSWSQAQPQWQEDKYLWIRYRIIYTNPESIEYTDPILDESWEKLKDLQDKIDNTNMQVETIKEDISEHTVAIGNITSKVGSMESTITTITENVEGLEGQVEQNKTIITETKDTVATHTTSLNNISGRIQLVESNTTNINGEITNLESRMDEAEQTLTKDGLTTIIGDSYATEEKVDDILISKDYATKSEVTQTTESITQSFTSSGGYNLLYNGNFKKGLTDWEVTGTGVSVINNQSCPSGYAVQIDGSTNTSKSISQIDISLDPNVDTYTLSWYQFTSSTGSDGATNPIRCPEIIIYYTDGTSETLVANNQTNYDVWEKMSKTIEKPSGKSFSYATVNFWNRDTTKIVYYSDVMLEKGSLSNIWSPNPNEIYDGISTFNKDGLMIEMIDGEGSQGYSCVSYDGFSVYDSNGDKKAWFGQDDKSYIKHLYTDDITCGRIVKKDVDMPTTFYVNATPPSGSDFSGLSVANACNSINEMIGRIKERYGEYLNWKNIKIEVANGVYNETVNIMGFMGSGQISIDLSSSVKVYGKWRIQDNTVAVVITGNRSTLDSNNGAELILTDEGYNALFYVKNSYCRVTNLRSLNKCYPKSDGTKYGNSFIYVLDNGNASMSNCDISRYYYGIRCNNSSRGCIVDCRGYVKTASIVRYGGYVGISTRPSETSASWANEGSFLKETNTTTLTSLYDVNYGGSTTATPPTTTSVSFSQSFALTNLRTVPEGSGSSTSGRSGQIGQGKWGNYKPHRGWGNIPTSLKEFCSGATNISMTITMTRVNTNHGYAGAVPAPVFVYSGGTWDSNATFSRGQTRTITLPSAIVSQIASGSMTSIQMWAGTSTNDYSFYNNVHINVTCTKNV